MSKMLDLGSTVAPFSETMQSLVHDIEQKCKVFVNGKAQSLTDFGTVFVGDDCLTALSKPFWHGVCDVQDTDILWRAPIGWRMPQLLRALGAFASASEAGRNGWNSDIPLGFSQHVFRISKIRGVLTVVKGASPVNCVTDPCAEGMPR
jgi:hypothetical protein